MTAPRGPRFAIGAQNECWPWLGYVSKQNGYGSFQWSTNGEPAKKIRAHRLVYTLLIGDIPQDLTLDHLCGNKICVNPAHLEAVPGVVNTYRAKNNVTTINLHKTHCIRGHAFDEFNTRYYTNRATGKVYRGCRECARLRRLAAGKGEKLAR